jgi:hypothetical protein
LRRDEAEAVRFYKLAADQGDALGQVYLGEFYERGCGGLPRDMAAAVRFYSLAADQGNGLALGALARLGRQREEEEARRREEERRQREAAARDEQRRLEDERRQQEAARERWKRQQEEARQRDEHERSRGMIFGTMTAALALEILGLSGGASEQEIQAAYRRLIPRVHPDRGGSPYLAKQLNAARDFLLRRRPD